MLVVIVCGQSNETVQDNICPHNLTVFCNHSCWTEIQTSFVLLFFGWNVKFIDKNKIIGIYKKMWKLYIQRSNTLWKSMIRPVSKRVDPVPYGFINDLNSLVHRTKACLVSALIPLLPHIVNTSLKHHFGLLLSCKLCMHVSSVYKN